MWILIQSGHGYSPRLDISPILTMCGQCWSVLAKNGFVTPRMTPGLKYMILLLDHTVLAISLALCLNTMPGLTGQVLVAFEAIILCCKAMLFSKWLLRSCPCYAQVIWKCNIIFMVRPTVNTNLSWEWIFSKTLFKPEEFENPSLEFNCGWKTVWKWKFLESMKSW